MTTSLTPFARVAIVMAALGALASPATAQDKLAAVEMIDNWSVFVDADAPQKYCYVASEPAETRASRTDIKRGEPFLLITNYPSADVANEISVRLGFEPDTAKDITLTIGSARFDLFADGEQAWLERDAKNGEAVAAMRRGATATVTATSQRGTEISDDYSLKGVTKALESAAERCK